jgi:hypothetical protein
MGCCHSFCVANIACCSAAVPGTAKNADSAHAVLRYLASDLVNRCCALLWLNLQDIGCGHSFCEQCLLQYKASGPRPVHFSAADLTHIPRSSWHCQESAHALLRFLASDL